MVDNAFVMFAWLWAVLGLMTYVAYKCGTRRYRRQQAAAARERGLQQIIDSRMDMGGGMRGRRL
jgi:hypothetical protein